jgi:hypothetical protein
MSLYNNIMALIKSVTIQMLANATNAPTPPIVNVTSMVSGSNTLTVASTSSAFAGALIVGDSITNNTTITDISEDGITLTLSQPVTATASNGQLFIGDVQNVIPLNYPDSPAGIQNAHSDYAFYLLTFTDQNINRQMDVSTDTAGNRVTTYVRNLKIDWQIYGDDAFEWADTLRIMLYDPDIRALFAAQGISLIPEINEPVFIPELKGNQWYHRYDVSAKFNQLVTTQVPKQVINSTNITIEDDKGVIVTCQF